MICISIKARWIFFKTITRLVIFIFCFGIVYSQTTPKLVSGLEFWLRADSQVVVNGSNQILTWRDLSGNSKNFTPVNTVTSPVRTIGGTDFSFPVIRFNGTQNDLINPATVNVKSVFILFNYSNSSFPGIAGLVTQVAIDGTKRFFNGEPGGTSFNDGIFLGNMKISGQTTNNFDPLNKMKILEGNLSAISTFTQMIIGSDFQVSNRRWIGDVAEIIVYSSTLSSSDRDQVLNYFYAKYGAKVQLGSDRCFRKDEILKPSKSFASYFWSNNATTSGITITEPGEYWLKGIDILGQVSMDTIQISQVIDVNKPATYAICVNDTLIWDTKLSTPNYSFRWNGNLTPSGSIAITTTGSINLQVQDQTTGCIVSDTLRITTTIGNNLKSQISLGSDTAVCAGNLIGLTKGESQVVNFQWNTGNKINKQVITVAGQYILKAKNVYGCTARDTLQVLSILGFAPIVNFKYDSICAGNAVNFTDLTVPPSGNSISKIYWQFNDGLVDSLNTNPVIIAPLSGTLKVKLTEKANNNCSNVSEKLFTVNPVPDLTFINTDVCTGVPMNFAPTAILTSGSISSWSWNFDAGATAISSLKNPKFTYTATGTYSVTLTAKTDKSCKKTISNSITIKKSIPVDFTYSSECYDKTVYFTETTVYPGNVSAFSRLWDLGDSTVTAVSAPAKSYAAPGIYQVKLTITASNGCANSTTKSVKVKSYPIADFSMSNICKGIPSKLTNLSTSTPDTINSYSWDFGNGKLSTLKEPQIAFADTGNFNVKLQVSSSGCQASTLKSIKVTAAPKPVFTISPASGEAPLMISTINKTSNAASYHWDFGNEEQSIETTPSTTYTSNGNYTIQLVSFNTLGCSDTSRLPVVVNAPIWDIELKTIVSIKDSLGKYLKINAKIRNNSNRPVDTVWIRLDQPDNVSYLQSLKGKILPGADTVFSMSNLIGYNGNLSHYCLTLELPGITETNLSNNTLCEVLASSPVVYPIEPNPVGNQMTVDFALPIGSNVTLKLINSIGKTAYENTSILSKGYHTSLIDTQYFSNGLYFLQFIAGNVKNVQRVMIMK